MPAKRQPERIARVTFFDFTEFLFRHRLEEALVNLDQTLKRSRLTFGLLLSFNRSQFHHGLVAARDDDLFAALDQVP